MTQKHNCLFSDQLINRKKQLDAYYTHDNYVIISEINFPLLPAGI